jgi:hypothetical protein
MPERKGVAMPASVDQSDSRRLARHAARSVIEMTPMTEPLTLEIFSDYV